MASPKTIVLLPGEHFVGDERFRVRTLLGSCVSITLWEPRQRIGAMSHFVLAGRQAPSELNGRYGNEALALMLDDLNVLGVEPRRCQAKVFGGGAMFDAETGLSDVGRMNGEAALALLHSHRIPVVSHSLFGAGHRQIIFNISSGDVWMRHVTPGSVSSPMPLDTGWDE